MGLDATVYKKSRKCLALEVRLGNISLIAHVRKHLLDAGVDPNGPLWFCIRSGSHSGDEIGFERIAALQAEIEAMFGVVQDLQVREFLQKLYGLVETAMVNEGAIYFT